MLDLRHLVGQEREVVSTLGDVCFALGEVFGHNSKVEGSYGLDEEEDLSHSRS